LHWVFYCCNSAKIHPKKNHYDWYNLTFFSFFSISLFTRCKIKSSFDEMQNLQVTNKKKRWKCYNVLVMPHCKLCKYCNDLRLKCLDFIRVLVNSINI
jgi:hypothetical protein